MTVQISDMDCDDGGFNPLYPAADGLTYAVDQVARQKPIRPASLAGR
jgi:hypothetical protein